MKRQTHKQTTKLAPPEALLPFYNKKKLKLPTEPSQPMTLTSPPLTTSKKKKGDKQLTRPRPTLKHPRIVTIIGDLVKDRLQGIF